LGGAVTYDQLMQLAELPDELSALMKRIGGLQVRQTGTIGGNIANGSPIGDMPPALIALGARIVLAHGQARRELAIEDFFLDYGRQDRGPGEVLIEIIIPRPHPLLALGFYKISKRFDQDISTLCGCFALSLDGDKVTDVRIAFGGMAGIPKRARSVEAKLLGQVWSAVTLDQAMAAFSEDFQPISDMRGSAEYRLLVARNLLKRFYLEQTGVLAKHARLDRHDVMIGDVN